MFENRFWIYDMNMIVIKERQAEFIHVIAKLLGSNHCSSAALQFDLLRDFCTAKFTPRRLDKELISLLLSYLLSPAVTHDFSLFRG